MAEPALDKAKLVELLGLAHEHEALDYKRRIDLNDRRDELELVKDVAAFSAEGGYLVIGADEGGKPSGVVTEAEALLFDESRLRAKVKRYLAEPLVIRTARHEVDGAPIVLVYIGAHPDGVVIVAADGQVGDKVVFRRGDVYLRHGTASERWGPEDFARIKTQLIERAQGIPELVPAPSSTHRVDEPHLLRMSPAGGLLYQSVFIEVENVGPAIARILNTTVNGYNAGALGSPRAPAAIPPYASRPFQVSAQVADEDGLPAGAEIALRILYEGGGRRRELLSNTRYYRSGGFENGGHNVWEA
jgi:hypothetical protein